MEPKTSPELDLMPETEQENKWKQNENWVLIASSAQVLPQHRRVRGGYSGTMYTISTQGVWVWEPDAKEILALQNLAACTGGHIKRPFGISRASRKQMRYKPSGPPDLI